MSEQKFPRGWDQARVIDHYENMSEDELLAEDEAAREAGKSHLSVPVANANGKAIVKRTPRQRKGKQPKALSRSKRRKTK